MSECAQLGTGKAAQPLYNTRYHPPTLPANPRCIGILNLMRADNELPSMLPEKLGRDGATCPRLNVSGEKRLAKPHKVQSLAIINKLFELHGCYVTSLFENQFCYVKNIIARMHVSHPLSALS